MGLKIWVALYSQVGVPSVAGVLLYKSLTQQHFSAPCDLVFRIAIAGVATTASKMHVVTERWSRIRAQRRAQDEQLVESIRLPTHEAYCC